MSTTRVTNETIKVILKKSAYRTKAKTRDQSFVEKTIGKKCNCRASIDYSKYIIQFKRSFSWFMMGLQNWSKFQILFVLVAHIYQIVHSDWLRTNCKGQIKIKIKRIFLVGLKVCSVRLSQRKKKHQQGFHFDAYVFRIWILCSQFCV